MPETHLLRPSPESSVFASSGEIELSLIVAGEPTTGAPKILIAAVYVPLRSEPQCSAYVPSLLSCTFTLTRLAMVSSPFFGMISAVTCAPPSTHALPIKSNASTVIPQPAPSASPTNPATVVVGKRVELACATFGATWSRKGEPGSATAICRSRTCSRYSPTRPIEYET